MSHRRDTRHLRLLPIGIETADTTAIPLDDHLVILKGRYIIAPSTPLILIVYLVSLGVLWHRGLHAPILIGNTMLIRPLFGHDLSILPNTLVIVSLGLECLQITHTILVLEIDIHELALLLAVKL